MAKAGNKLFYLGENPYLPEGTLVELIDQPQLILPDRGDGVAITFDRKNTLECPDFAENIPPGQCPVRVTSSENCHGQIDLLEDIHFQKFQVPIPSDTIESVIINDRVSNFEADSYWPSSDNAEPYQIHISHLPPGFYEADITLRASEKARLTFIKFFPPRFSAAYPASFEEQLRSHIPAKLITITAYEPDYEADLLSKALELATEWGENFRKPIHDRIRVFYPELDDEEIDRLTTAAREAESYIYHLGERELAGEIGEHDIPHLAREKYPWLKNPNLSRLSGVAMFYARK